MKKILYGLILGFSGAVFSQTAADHLQTKINDMRSLTATFKQVVKSKSKIVSQSSGTMALLRPGKFRWDTKEPMEQLMIADGKKLWIYDKDLEQVTVKKQEKGLGGTAALFLSGYNENVTNDFNVSQSQKGEQVSFDLKAKSTKSNFQRLILTFKNALLTELEMFDQLGQVTSVHFANEKLNPQLNLSLFQFKTPKGVDVVEQ